MSTRFVGIRFFARRTPSQTTDYLDKPKFSRRRIELPVEVLPVSFYGQTAEVCKAGDPIVAITRDASRRGVAFMHDRPIEGEYAIVTVDLLDGSPVLLLLQVSWSNVQSGFTFMSGGKFIGIAEWLPSFNCVDLVQPQANRLLGGQQRRRPAVIETDDLGREVC